MKKILSIAIAALMFVAQPVMAQNDAKAKAILEGVSKKINGLKTLKANFTLTMQGKSQGKKTGSISMKGPKFRMALDKTEIICDGKTQWTYMKDAKEVQVSNYNPAEQTLSPAKLFSGSYDKEYTYKYTGTRAVGGKTCDIVEMTPTNKTKGFTKVELAVDPKTSTIVGGNVWEKNGNKYQYTISGFTANPAIADNYFTFEKNKYPGVEVVDLR